MLSTKLCTRTFWFFYLQLVVADTLLTEEAFSKRGACGDNEVLRSTHRTLCSMLDWAEADLEGLARHLHDWADTQGLLIDLRTNADGQGTDTAIVVRKEAKVDQSLRLTSKREVSPSLNVDRLSSRDGALPVVLSHGMGDSCFNDGMQRVTAKISQLLDGVYTVCIPIGKSQAEDTSNGYFLNMDATVELFAQAVEQDPQLQNGFHALGFSQGNNVIRGYIAKFNSPPVHTFISVNGVNAGIGAVPYCRPSLSAAAISARRRSAKEQEQLLTGIPSVCDLLMEQASRTAYTTFAQEHSFQANYWRDPRPSAQARYQKFGQLAVWNNEAGYVNQTLRDNWAKTSKFVWVLASRDGMVWPREGEQWGAPDPVDPFQRILPMNETAWFQSDLFGLQTAQEQGKNFFESFDGDHLQFTEQDLERWIATYLSSSL